MNRKIYFHSIQYLFAFKFVKICYHLPCAQYKFQRDLKLLLCFFSLKKSNWFPWPVVSFDIYFHFQNQEFKFMIHQIDLQIWFAADMIWPMSDTESYSLMWENGGRKKISADRDIFCKYSSKCRWVCDLNLLFPWALLMTFDRRSMIHQYLCRERTAQVHFVVKMVLFWYFLSCFSFLILRIYYSCC